MSSEKSARRTFLKSAGAGLACSGLLALPTASLGEPVTTAAKPSVFDVTKFGARGDGKTLDTPAINRAIEAATAAGGGTVHFPAGTYLCFSIHVKSNVTLDLSRGTTIVAADSAPGCAVGRHSGGHTPPGHHQQHCVLGRTLIHLLDHHGNSGASHRRTQVKQHIHPAHGRRHQGRSRAGPSRR